MEQVLIDNCLYSSVVDFCFICERWVLHGFNPQLHASYQRHNKNGKQGTPLPGSVQQKGRIGFIGNISMAMDFVRSEILRMVNIHLLHVNNQKI